jgi:hypothetical protein
MTGQPGGRPARPRRIRIKDARAFLLIAFLAAVGCVLLLLDRAEYDAAQAFKSATECADVNSAACFQRYPGVIEKVRRAQTSEGEQDAVTLTSRQVELHVSLTPSAADAALVQPRAKVSVEWYVGSVATVWIAGHAIPTTSNLGARHANIGFVGGIVVWLAALLMGIVLVGRRMAVLFAEALALPRPAVASTQVLLPTGYAGWLVKPQLREALLLPFGIMLLALVSVRLFINPGTRVLALAGDALVLIPVAVGLVLTLRNARLMLDPSSVVLVDGLGRHRSWPVSEIDQAAIVGVRWTDWSIPSLLFVRIDGEELFAVTSLLWDLGQLISICAAIGVPVTFGYRPARRRAGWRRRTAQAIFAVVSGALLIASFFPPPPSNS